MSLINGDTVQEAPLVEGIQGTEQAVAAGQALWGDEDDLEHRLVAAQIAHHLHLLLRGLGGAEVAAGDASLMQMEHLQPVLKLIEALLHCCQK